MELSVSLEAISRSATQEIIDSKDSLSCSQVPSTGPYPEPDETNPYHPILFLYSLI
jgi:hypothetical protein